MGNHPVIFVCEFGSKKSVLAASWFSHRATKRGLELRGESRGITPDAEVPERIRQELRARDLPAGDQAPEALCDLDWTRARMIVSFTEEPLEGRGNVEVRSWADVPALSDDFDVASKEIQARVCALVEELEREIANSR